LVHADSTAGQVKNVIGDATVTLPGGKHEQATTDMTIPAGSRIQTGADSKVLIEWMPGALSVITSNANVVVSSLGYSDAGGAPQRKVALKLTKGSVFSHLAHNNGTSDFTIKTPSGVAAARGTDWEVTVNGTTTTVAVVSSDVTFTSPSGLTIDIQAGQIYSIGGLTRPLSQDELDAIITVLQQAGIQVGPTNVNQVHQHGTFYPPLDEVPTSN
jgi:hypothetical protein